MLGFMLSQLALRLLSAILGGYGIFCLIMSFAVPEVGAQAFMLLLIRISGNFWTGVSSILGRGSRQQL